MQLLLQGQGCSLILYTSIYSYMSAAVSELSHISTTKVSCDIRWPTLENEA